MKILETQRLILRKWQEKDVYDLFAIMKNESVSIGGWKPHSSIDSSVNTLNEYVKDKNKWAIELKGEKVIGCIGICPDNNRGKLYAKSVNFVLSDSYSGNGYMTEAVNRVIQYAFEELNVDLLSAFHIPDNIKSKRVLEKCGFKYEIVIEHGYNRYDGQVFDSVCYSLSKSDYSN